MKGWKIVLIVISSLALAAHFSRQGMTILMLASLVIPALLFLRREPIDRAVQLFFLLGSMEWVRIMVVYARQRQAIGEPWLRLAAILTGMVLLTAAAAWLSGSRRKQLGK